MALYRFHVVNPLVDNHQHCCSAKKKKKKEKHKKHFFDVSSMVFIAMIGQCIITINKTFYLFWYDFRKKILTIDNVYICTLAANSARCPLKASPFHFLPSAVCWGSKKTWPPWRVGAHRNVIAQKIVVSLFSLWSSTYSHWGSQVPLSESPRSLESQQGGLAGDKRQRHLLSPLAPLLCSHGGFFGLGSFGKQPEVTF
jgi:hypothetical protein